MEGQKMSRIFDRNGPWLTNAFIFGTNGKLVLTIKANYRFCEHFLYNLVYIKDVTVEKKYPARVVIYRHYLRLDHHVLWRFYGECIGRRIHKFLSSIKRVDWGTMVAISNEYRNAGADVTIIR